MVISITDTITPLPAHIRTVSGLNICPCSLSHTPYHVQEGEGTGTRAPYSMYMLSWILEKWLKSNN